MRTPVAFSIFNRPEVTQRVFDRIREARPPQLLVIGDGPRTDRPDAAEEADRVAQARAIAQQVDWPCEVLTEFSERNLGCKQRIASGLDWAFEQVEELIFLEDDCLPDLSFFSYCEQLLDRYRDDPRVMVISGDNFQPCSRTDASYYFSRWAHIWGWATWRRAWQHFDVEIASWPAVKATGQLRQTFDSDAEYEYWCDVLDRQHAGQIDTWDFPWAYACWVQEGLTALPNRNLVANLGFGPDATHTTDPGSRLADKSTHEIGPLSHPPRVVAHREADRHTWETIFRPPPPQPVPARRTAWYQRWFQIVGTWNRREVRRA